MTTLNAWYIFLSGVVLPIFELTAGTADFSYSLKPQTIQPGERATLEIRLHSESAQSEDLVSSIFTNDELLIKHPSIQTLKKEEFLDSPVKIWRYELTSYRTGQLNIPPLEIQIGARTFSTTRMTMHVSSTRSEIDLGLREGFDLVRIPLSIGLWIISILIIIGVLLIIFFTERYWILFFKRAKTPPPVHAPVPKEDGKAWLRIQLLQLRNQVESGVVNRPIDALTSILKRYLAKQFFETAEACTTRELKQNTITNSTLQDLCEILEGCDNFKFRGDRSSAGLELAAHYVTLSEQLLLSGSNS